ncbi:MAG: SDR family oxidoreductase [Armatimonadetes bacterium]|nr:SDR family oxidoreductase [Armatimonadota bacterium]
MATRRVLVTGGSRGIGRAIAMRLALDGWDVAIHYVNDEAEARHTESDMGPRASGRYQADLNLAESAKELIDKALRDGPLNAVVNNAGVYMPMSYVKSGEAEFEATFRRTFSVNFESPMRIMRYAAQHFDVNGGGKILNVASRVGFKGEGGAALYAASKGALINLTRSLAVELAPRNIQLFGIAPGWVETAMAREGMETKLESILKDIPLGRMAKPEDCASVAAFLLSDGAAYLSGNVIDINGASYFH